MLRKQHKMDASHYDMPLIYYTEGHSLHFGRPEFALITGLPFGHVNFGLYTSGELKFHNRVFLHKLGLSVTNLDFIGVIEDEETFQKLCDEDSILSLWNVIEKQSDEHYFGIKKDRMYVTTYTLSGFVFAFQVWIFESFERCNCWWIKDPNVIPRADGWSKKSICNRSDCGYLFAKESTTTSDIRPTKVEYESSWWIHYLVEEELRLYLEAEERMRLKHEKNIIEEQRFRVEEAKRMKLEEEKLLEISELKKGGKSL
ncbi:hypothetical protein Tco_0066832 [Tanacetum coccineum]